MLATSEKNHSLEEIAEILKKERAAEHGGRKRLKYPPEHYCDIYIQPGSEGGQRMLIAGYQTTIRGQTLTLTEVQSDQSEDQNPSCDKCGSELADDGECLNCLNYPRCPTCGYELDDDGACPLNNGRCKPSTWPQQVSAANEA